MSSYHALSSHGLKKQAANPFYSAGRHLLTRGFWPTLERAGARLASGGGRYAHLGGKVEAGARRIGKVAPWLEGYGMVGMAAPIFGHELPGSEFALAVGDPFYSGVYAVPELIRTGRLSSGKYDQAIEQDAKEGARLAGSQWMDTINYDPRAAYDTNAYLGVLRTGGVDTESAGKYLTPGQIHQPSTYHKIFNSITDSNANLIPEVQQRIYNTLNKSASIWGGVKKIAPMLLPAAVLGGGAYNTYDAITSDKPYDVEAVKQEGADAAQAAIRRSIDSMSPYQRMMVRLDPSLAVQEMEKKLPGTVGMWEQMSGSPYQPGVLSGMRSAFGALSNGIRDTWNSRGVPKFYSTDAYGNQIYLK